nr:sporamin [Ipomoea batatas]
MTKNEGRCGEKPNAWVAQHGVMESADIVAFCRSRTDIHVVYAELVGGDVEPKVLYLEFLDEGGFVGSGEADGKLNLEWAWIGEEIEGKGQEECKCEGFHDEQLGRKLRAFKVVVDHLNLELVAIVGDELAGFHEILPGFTVVLDPPVYVVYAEFVGRNVESEGLERRRHDHGGFRVRRRDGGIQSDESQASAAGAPYGGDYVVIFAGPDFVAVDVEHRSFGRRRFMGGAEADGIELGMSWVGEEIEGKYEEECEGFHVGR